MDMSHFSKVAWIAPLALCFCLTSWANENREKSEVSGLNEPSSLVEVCKKECPKAATVSEAHQCAEKLEKKKDFKKTQCYKVHEKYEQQAGEAEEKEHESSS